MKLHCFGKGISKESKMEKEERKKKIEIMLNLIVKMNYFFLWVVCLPSIPLMIFASKDSFSLEVSLKS